MEIVEIENGVKCVKLIDLTEYIFTNEYQFGTQTNDCANNWERLKKDISYWENVAVDQKDSKKDNK